MTNLELACMNYEAVMGGPYELEQEDDLCRDDIISSLMGNGGMYDPEKPSLLQEAMANASDEAMCEISDAMRAGNAHLFMALCREVSRMYWLKAAENEADETIEEENEYRDYRLSEPAEHFDN